MDNELKEMLLQVLEGQQGIYNRLGRIETEVSMVKDRLGAIESEIEMLNTRVDTLSTRLTAIEHDVKHIKRDVQEIKFSHRTFASEVKQSMDNISKTKQDKNVH